MIRELINKTTIPRIMIASFMMVIAIGTVLLCVSNNISVIDALFTSVSATCVTGLLTINCMNDLNFFGQVVVLIMIQVGGLGLMSFVVLMLEAVKSGVSIKEKKYIKDSLNKDDMSGVSLYLKKVFLYTAIFELTGFILYLPSFYNGTLYSVFQSLFLSISAFCNAGIDIVSESSLVPFQTDVSINLITSALIVAGGLGFAVWFDLFDYRKKKKKLHTKIVLKTTAVLIIVGTVLIFILERNNLLSDYGLFDKFMISLFNSITLRTAGFSTFDYESLTSTTKIIMLPFMIVGASPGGTGGGLKTTTLFIVVYSLIAQVQGKNDVVFSKKEISRDLIVKASLLTFSYILCMFISVVFLSATEDIDLLNLVFESASAIGTVGLSAGVTGLLSNLGKINIMILMFLGRVGPVTFASIIKRESKNVSVRYPDAEILVG